MIVVGVGNVAFWAVCHSATGWWAHRLPADRLARDGPVLRLRSWERDGRIYEQVFLVKRWKDRLPEAGALFAGGVSKRTLGGDLQRFVVETRRAERGHWLAMAGGPIAVLWNPPLGAVVMVLYGVVVNVPFIAIQRYNRARALRVLERSSGSRCLSSRSGDERTSGSNIP